MGMIVLDIAAPIFLMIGIKIGTASNASLLGNFEIVATTLIALLIFKEKVSGRLWTAIGFITMASIVLSFEGNDRFHFSGEGSFAIAMLLGENLPEPKYIAAVMLLGFIAYGLSIFLYIRAQRDLGAAGTVFVVRDTNRE